MANDLNQCNFIGRLGKDIETKFLPSGDAVLNNSLAIGWKGKDKEGVEWVNLVFFGKSAEICAKYLHKGSRIFVTGRIQTRKYQATDGSDRYSTEVVVNNFQMLDGKPDSNGEPKAQPQAKPAQQQGPLDDFDDIPF